MAGPSAPVVTNLTCRDERSIFLQWQRPRVVYKTVDLYYVYYRNEEQWKFREVAVDMNATYSTGSKVSECVEVEGGTMASGS